MRPFQIPRFFGVFLMLLASACSSPRQDASKGENTLSDTIGAYLSQQHEAGKFSGNVLVAQGNFIYQASFGKRNSNPQHTLQLETPFYLCSVSKQFTAMAIMLAEHQGLLDLDDPIQRYLPDLPPYTKPITIRHMLTHTSGLPDYYDLGAFKVGMTNDDVIAVLMEQDTLEFRPGSKYSYSNSAYVLLSVIVEKASKVSFKNFVASHIFAPLGMESSTVFDTQTADIPNRAVGYTQEGEIDDYTAYTTGGGGIFSNIPDLRKWDLALYSEVLLPQSKIKEAYTPYSLTDGTMSYYGFGWRLDEAQPWVVQHSGSLAGFRTYMYRDLEKKRSIILLSNHTSDVVAIKDGLVEILTAQKGTI